MLNKEQRQQAEKMAAELAPLYEKAAKLAEKWIRVSKFRRQCEDAARFWQYVGTGSEWAHGETMTEEEKNEARKTKESPQAWRDALYIKYEREHQAQQSENAARLNYLNYLYYICEVVADKLRPYAWKIYNTRGDTFKEWAEIISPKTCHEYSPRQIYTSIYINSCFSDSICLDIHTNGGGACGAFTSLYSYYKEENPTPRQTHEPKAMTGKQYAQRMAAIDSYYEQARRLVIEQRKKAQEWGLMYAAEVLTYPTKEKAR